MDKLGYETNDFKKIHNYPNYVMTKQGDVFSMRKATPYKLKYLKIKNSSKKVYNAVYLSHEGKQKMFSVCQLMGIVFFKTKSYIGFSDGNTGNCNISNLYAK